MLKAKAIYFLNKTYLWVIILSVTTILVRNYQDSTLFIICMLIICGILAIIIHELGHFIFGKIVGFKLSILSLVIFLVYGGKVYINHPLLMSFGFTGMYARNVNHIKSGQCILFNSGGAIFNAILIVIFSLIRARLSGNHSITEEFLNYSIIINFIIIIITLLPFLKDNDGFHIIDLIKNKENSVFFKGFVDNSYYMNDKISPNSVYEHFTCKSEDNFKKNLIKIEKELHETGIFNSHNLKIINEDFNEYEYNILKFYKIVFLYIEHTKLSFEDIKFLEKINLAYGKTFCLIKECVVNENLSISEKKQILDKVKVEMKYIGDFHQMNIIRGIVTNLNEVI